MQLLLLPDSFAVDHRIERRSATAHLALMRALSIVFVYPFVKILLELREVTVNALSECDFVELIQNGLVEAFNDSVRLRVSYLGPRVLDVIECQIQLVVMMLGLAAILRSPISQDTQDR